MTSHLSTWIFFDDAGVSNTLHSRNICLCKKSSNIFGKTQDSNAGRFSKKGGSCDAEKIIEAFKTVPGNCSGRNLSVKKCKNQATKMKKKTLKNSKQHWKNLDLKNYCYRTQPKETHLLKVTQIR